MSSEIEMLFPVLVPLAALLGLVLGSFLNVVIYRVPQGLSVVSPGSTCPTCETPIKGRDNIPLLSWLLLRGKCRACAEPISSRYPLVEAATGVLFATVAWVSLHRYAEMTPVLLYLTAIGVALFMIDVDVKRLPDAIVLPSYPVVVALLALAGVVSGHWPLVRTVEVAVLVFFVFAVPWFVTAGRGMGFGDVKLAPLIGLVLGWLGWGQALVGLMAGFASGVLLGIVLVAFRGAGRKTAIGFGPHMLIGAFVSLLFGEHIWNWYLNLFGLA